MKFLYFLGQGTAEVLFKDFFYQSSDKIALGGWVINAGREEPSLLFCGGSQDLVGKSNGKPRWSPVCSPL